LSVKIGYTNYLESQLVLRLLLSKDLMAKLFIIVHQTSQKLQNFGTPLFAQLKVGGKPRMKYLSHSEKPTGLHGLNLRTSYMKLS
jgi:hypothetical protein